MSRRTSSSAAGPPTDADEPQVPDEDLQDAPDAQGETASTAAPETTKVPKRDRSSAQLAILALRRARRRLTELDNPPDKAFEYELAAAQVYAQLASREAPPEKA